MRRADPAGESANIAPKSSHLGSRCGERVRGFLEPILRPAKWGCPILARPSRGPLVCLIEDRRDALHQRGSVFKTAPLASTWWVRKAGTGP